MAAAASTILAGALPLRLVLPWMALGAVLGTAFGVANEWRSLLHRVGKARAMSIQSVRMRLAATFTSPSDGAVTLVRV